MCLFVKGAACVFQVAVFALGNSGVSFEQYSVTFDDYLNEELSQQLGCSFNVTALYATTTVFDALAAEDLDFAFVDPTNYACLSVSHVSVFAAPYPLVCCK